MSTQTKPQSGWIRKQSTDGIGSSVVSLGGVSHVFAAAAPRDGGTLDEQVEDALRTIEGVIDEESNPGAIVHQAVFFRDPADLRRCKAMIREFYGEHMPATTYINQPPCCDRQLVSIEALGVGHGDEAVEIERRGEHMVITRHGGISWYHLGQIVPSTRATSVHMKSLNAFRSMQARLAEEGVDMSQVLRTWLYLGDIVAPEGDSQRYKELNRARTDFFKGIEFSEGRLPASYGGPAYPASTGIGMSNRDIVMSCIAVDADPDQFVVVPLENPNQTSAFDYGAVYSPKSPKFARAMAVAAGRCATIFVSGTASIVDSETIWKGDAARQTVQTLDNIEALIGEGNFVRYGLPGLGATLDHLAFARVYIKRPEDYPAVRAECERRLGELPTIYAIADVCRDDLLVEIEAVAFSSRCAKKYPETIPAPHFL